MASAAATSKDGQSQSNEPGSSSQSVSSGKQDTGRGDPHDRHKSVGEVDLGVSQPEGKGKAKNEEA